tara:strand:+ start:35296 stop:37674 length:2379 start_codon:yes stop_codon:yes gene_type:complete
MNYKLSDEEFKSKLKELSEEQFRLLLIQLFEKLGFHEVDHHHGVTEFGKDVVFYEEDKFMNKVWYACVVKSGDINQSELGIVHRQVRESFKSKYPSTTYGRVNIDKVIVICSGVFKGNSKILIADELDDAEKSKVLFWPQTMVVKYLIEQDLTTLLVEKNQNILLSKYNEQMLTNVLQNKSLKFLQSDFNIDINNFEDFELSIKAKSTKFEKEREEYLEGNTKQIPVKFLPDVKKIIENKKSIFIHGIATSGKSTILKKIGKDFILAKPNSIVFYVELNKLKQDSDTGISDYIEKEYFTITKHHLNIEDYKDHDILLLLDGLDEVKDANLRSKIITEIKGFHVAANNIQIILSSRTADQVKNDLVLDSIFEQFELMSLNLGELVKVGEKIISDEQQAKSFVQVVTKGEIVNAFPKTPLTSILLAILFKEDKIDPKDLPRNVTELYEKFMDLFLDKWDKERGVSQQYKLKERLFVLREIARKMHLSNSIEIDEQELKEYLEELKVERPVEILENSEEFLKNLCANSNILIYNGDLRQFRFFHLTIQEYLASLAFGVDNENDLVINFLNEWWLNPNIFYAGKTPEQSNVLTEISALKVYPVDAMEKSTFIVHTSKVLKAAHLISKTERKKVLKTMIGMFDGTIKGLIMAIIGDEDPKFYKRTILDVILWARSFYMDYFSSKQFEECLQELWMDIVENKDTSLTDITRYCIAYDLSVLSGEAKYLLEFIDVNEDLNVRWSKIVEVDINIKHLNHDRNGKPILKLKQNSVKNKKYIAQQFNERIAKHYKSITSIDN